MWHSGCGRLALGVRWLGGCLAGVCFGGLWLPWWAWLLLVGSQYTSGPCMWHSIFAPCFVDSCIPPGPIAKMDSFLYDPTVQLGCAFLVLQGWLMSGALTTDSAALMFSVQFRVLLKFLRGDTLHGAVFCGVSCPNGRFSSKVVSPSFMFLVPFAGSSL
ncbi:hypothetical protein U1Q18_016355 [Sarracenia purpurea var. burkii]